MNDPLTLVRLATMKGATVVCKDDEYVFGSQVYPAKVETCFRRTLASAKAQYYTLKDVIFFVQSNALSMVEYRRAVVKERCVAVVEADSKALMSYLTGEVDSVPQIDLEKAAEVVAQFAAGAAKKSKESSSQEGLKDIEKTEISKLAANSIDPVIASAEQAQARNEDEKALQRKRKLFKTLDGSDPLIGTDGFVMAPPEAIKASKMRMIAVRQGQVSVADRVSVLRSPKVDFGFVLKNYNDHVLKTFNKSDASSKSDSNSNKKLLPAMKQLLKPIIIVPSAFSGTILNSSNAKDMLADNVYIPLEEARARGMERVTEQTISRKIPGSRVDLKYKVIDNPVKLANDDWNSVVAVFATGHTWQFKDWKWAEPRQLFSNVLGVHLCMDDTAISENILQWNCKVLKVNRSKRHTDAIAMNQFWSHVDQFVKLHRPDIHKVFEDNIANMKQ